MINRFIKFLVKPYNIFLFTNLLSFIAWLIPDMGGKLRKGFSSPYETSEYGVLILFFWIVFIFLTSYLGFKVGDGIKINTELFDKYASLKSKRPIKIMLFLSLIGVSYVVFQLITSLGFNGIINAVINGQANELKDTLYNDYTPGLPSLRYVAIPTAALALYHLFNKRYIFLSILSILMLLVVSVISSRLSIIYTIFIFLSLIGRDINLKIRFLPALIGFLVVLNLLFALNYSRNIHFYRSIGIDGFYEAGISEIITYIGSPFQGQLAASNDSNILQGASELDTHQYTLISPELSTNSALLELVRRDDLFVSFVSMSLYTMFAAFFMGISWKNRSNILLLLFGTLGYCFAEIWRIDLFSQGIVLTIIIAVLLSAVICVLWPRNKLYISVSQRND